MGSEMLRFAQHDILGFGRENSLSYNQQNIRPCAQGRMFLLVVVLD